MNDTRSYQSEWLRSLDQSDDLEYAHFSRVDTSPL